MCCPHQYTRQTYMLRQSELVLVEQADLIASRVLEGARPGRIVLMHDGGGDRTQTVEALETVLQALSEQGYTFDVACQ